MPEPVLVYIHIPFCPSKCGYCDFNSYAMEGEIMARTSQAIIEEIRRSPWAGRPAQTIFFGGGTPTFIPEDQLIAIFEQAVRTHPPVENCEITSEANPGTVDASRFRAMREAGFNRVSLGAQSFADGDLLTLGRIHRASEIERAVEAARSAGFENLNLDLMFALPGQSLRAWEVNLKKALSLQPDHLSLYCLTLEPNTPFYKQHLKGLLHVPDEDSQVAMYEATLATMAGAGYEQYEISNFARRASIDYRCRHNLGYWRGEEYAGYGPGAVGCIDFRRYTNLKHPERYCTAVEAGQCTAFEEEHLSVAIQRVERIMLGIRLNEGLSSDLVPMERLRKLQDRHWIQESEGRIRLTDEGRHFCSEVALELI